MAWYYDVGIVVYVVCFFYGFGWAVVYSDKFDQQVEAANMFLAWFICGIIGPVVVISDLLYRAYKAFRRNRAA
jgi:hypothetical protein